ncbi:MAG: hypothetical protein ACP5RN_07555 [Armatimonadota bacterium]
MPEVWLPSAKRHLWGFTQGIQIAIAPDEEVEYLRVRFLIERFENGAEVTVEATFRSDRPDEVCLVAEPTPNSAPPDQCVLTATMGNYIRARQLWLRDAVVHSRELFGSNFDLVERFHDNSPFCFGVTRKPPSSLAILNYRAR